jgi:hypothetical protein
MQFESNFSHGDANCSSMYLPGMGRINHKPILKQSKNLWGSSVVDLKTNDNASVLKKSTSTNIEKPASSKSEESTTSSKQKKVVRIQTPESASQVRSNRWTKKFLKPVDTAEANSAATQIQRAARGRCARTNYRIMVLEHKLATIEHRQAAEIQAIDDALADKKMAMRRKATKKEAKTVKKHLACTETANEGSKLIHYLRSENKKLRTKNDKIASSIMELRAHNARLEEATTVTGDNQSLLGSHYVKIKETNETLLSVVPKYKERIQEMTEALEVRRQYCLSEHKMKVMYVKLVGTLAEMVEHHSNDKDLTEEVVALCLDLESEEDVTESSRVMLEDCKEVVVDDNDEYDEISVSDDDDSDSNNYDEYTVAKMG